MLGTSLAVAFAGWLSVVGAVKPLVDLGYSKYLGNAYEDGITSWLGVRYAAAPLGNLRFSKPQDPVYTKKVQVADKHGPICLGTGVAVDSPSYAVESEDCLFLDVYAPSGATPNSKLPVFFFIQGGGFVTNSDSNFNGSGLVAAGDKAMIVVNFNYRVGVYGFLADGDQVTPNNGLWDQVQALEWVQQHIASFGGDPAHVVIGGDSAGAGSVSFHLTRDQGTDHGLFIGAAAESVPFGTLLSVSDSQYLYDNFAIRADCAVADSLACLRSKSTKQLQAANVDVQPYPGQTGDMSFAWQPVIDGDFITEVTYQAYQKGHFIKVPLIVGDDMNGGTIFTPQTATTVPDMNVFLRDQYPFLQLTDLEDIFAMYPNPNKTCPNEGCRWRQVSNAFGQMRFMCPGIFINQAFATAGVTDSWSYLWNVEDPEQVAEGLGVPHTVEVNAIFGPDNTNGKAPASYYPNGTNAHAVTVAQAYWSSFVRTLDPNTYRADGSAVWKPLSASKRQRMEFGTGGSTSMQTLPSDLEKACKFFAGIGVRITQ